MRSAMNDSYAKLKALVDDGKVVMEPNAEGGYVMVYFTIMGAEGQAQFAPDTEGLYALTFFHPLPFLDAMLKARDES